MLPDQQTQHLFFSDFQERVLWLMKEASRNQQSLNVTDAEQKVWQQLEEELLHVSLAPGEESDTSVHP